MPDIVLDFKVQDARGPMGALDRGREVLVMVMSTSPVASSV